VGNHSESKTIPADRADFRGGPILLSIGAIVAVVGIMGAVFLGREGPFAYRPFLFGYLAAYVFVIALPIGSLVFVLLQHLTRAAWSIGVRRTAEDFAGALPVLAIFVLPLLMSVGSLNGYLYRWALPMDRASKQAVEAAEKGQTELEEPSKLAEAKPDHPVVVIPVSAQEEVDEAIGKVAAPSDPAAFTLDPLVLLKRNYGLHWLNPWFFIFRQILYLSVWSAIAIWYRKTSLLQDRTGDDSLSLRMKERAAPCLAILGLTVTGAAFDLLMSLDPHWYSTMFGIYYIINAIVGNYALLIVTIFVLQLFGHLRKTVTIEHFHDLGKYLFAFTFFYGYVAFSQYMLMWYSNIPEETQWMARHGASTAIWNGWNHVIVLILFGHFLIPFVGLLSRFPKRHPGMLVFWALWQLVFVAVDMYWLVTPEMGPTEPQRPQIAITAAAIAGLLGVLFATFGFLASRASLRPEKDPRLADSLAFENI